MNKEKQEELDDLLTAAIVLSELGRVVSDNDSGSLTKALEDILSEKGYNNKTQLLSIILRVLSLASSLLHKRSKEFEDSGLSDMVIVHAAGMSLLYAYSKILKGN